VLSLLFENEKAMNEAKTEFIKEVQKKVDPAIIARAKTSR
jgi:hypothetical protein